MARRAFLHLGTPKSGTTFLQSLWWHNHDELAERGLLLPGSDADEQFQAAALIRANPDVLSTMGPRELAAWDRVAAQAAAWSGDVLISQEQLVEAPGEQARAVVDRILAEVADEVHLVVTTRDLVRQVPSAWQQRVKHGSDTTLRRFCRRLVKDDPTFNFWRHQDVPRILDRWAPGLPADRVHVVVLPRPGAEHDLLWRRTCALLGLDSTGLDLQAPVANETLAPEEIAFLRLVNTHFGQAHREVARSRRIKTYMDARLGSTPAPGSERLLLPADLHPWFVERGNAMADELAGGAWQVVGDLDDLRPDPERGSGVDPDAISDARVLARAVEFIAAGLRERAADPAPGPSSEPETETEPEPETEDADGPPSPSLAHRVGARVRRLGQRGTKAQ